MLFLKLRITSRCRWFSESLTLDKKIETAWDNKHLLSIYNDNALTQTQKLKMLQTMSNKLPVMHQVMSLYKTAIGQRYMKEMISGYEKLKPVEQTWILALIATTTGKFRKAVISVDTERNLIHSIGANLDPKQHPHECLKAYRDSALIKILTLEFETKVILVLEEDETLKLKDLEFAAEGALRSCREKSFHICKKVEKYTQRELDWENVKDLVGFWRWASEMYVQYDIGGKILTTLTQRIMDQKDLLDIEDILKISEVYLKNIFFPKELILAGFGKIQEKAGIEEFFWGDNLEKIILNLSMLQIKGFDLKLHNDFYFLLMDQVSLLNIHGRIKNSECFNLLNHLTEFTKTLSPFSAKRLKEKYEEANEFEKICISALMSKCGSIEMKNVFTEFCEKVVINKRFSYATISNLHYFIKCTGLESESREIERCLVTIEESFASMIVDYESFFQYYSILKEHEEWIKKNALWDKVVEKSIKVIRSISNTYNSSPVFFLSRLIELYSYSSKNNEAWQDLVKELISKMSPKDIIDTFYPVFNENYLEALVEILKISSKPHFFALAHCLSINIRKPSYRLLTNTTNLMQNLNTDFLNEKRLHILGHSLFAQIFKKGFSPQLHKFLFSLSYLKVITSTNIEQVLRIINLSAQYGHLSHGQARILSKMKFKEIKDNSNHFVALGTVIPELVDLDSERFQNFFQIDGCESAEILEKVNLYMKFEKKSALEEEFLSSIEQFIVNENEKDHFLLVEFLQGLSSLHKNTHFFESVLKLLVEVIMGFKISSFSKNELAFILIAILEKGFKGSEHVNTLEQLIGNKLDDEDLLEQLIRVYLKIGIHNDFLEATFAAALNTLKDSTFIELVSLKNQKP